MKKLPEMGLLALAIVVLWIEPALAEGITEFAGPVEKVAKTLQGPVGKSISTLAIALCGLGYWYTRGDDGAGIWKNVLGIVFVICLMCFAGSMLDTIGLTFGGAVL